MSLTWHLQKILHVHVGQLAESLHRTSCSFQGHYIQMSDSASFSAEIRYHDLAQNLVSTAFSTIPKNMFKVTTNSLLYKIVIFWSMSC